VAYTLPRVETMRGWVALLFLVACGGEEMTMETPDASTDLPAKDAEPELLLDSGAPDGGADLDASEVADSGIEERPPTFIGSPCEVDADCTYEGAVCLTDGFPGGSCSLACDRFCPDLDGFPTTFCVAKSALPSSGSIAGDGACVSRCSFGDFPETGCRAEYGCIDIARVNEPGTVQNACIPGAESNVSDCMRQLSMAGVDFEPTVIADTSPDGRPDLVCHVEEPVIIHPPLHGVDLKYFDGDPTPNVRAACNMALALSKTAQDVAARGVTAIRHIGTYNCRVIAGTDRLSRHSYADAIDIYGFEFADGSLYTLVDHWEHETMMPMTTEAIFLYETAYRWHDDQLWTIILTPNYNAAHDNHFHVDLTPGSDFIQLLPSDDFGYIGPAPYAD
jgi:hypothetical protein